MSRSASSVRGDRPERPLAAGAIVVALDLLPYLAAIWLVPHFLTQDGPSRLYNASVILASLRHDPALAAVFELSRAPLPKREPTSSSSR